MSYEELWNDIEAFDKKHYFNNTTYQLREVKYIIKTLEKFHYDSTVTVQIIKNYKKEEYEAYHNEVNELIEYIIRENYNVEDVKINILKDRIHEMWKIISLGDLGHDDFKRKHYKKFTKKEKQNLVMGRNKEGHDKTQENRERFLLDYLTETKNEVMYDALGSLLHDDSQQKRNTIGLIDDLVEVINAHSLGVIKDTQYRSFLDRSLIVIKGSASAYINDFEDEEKRLYQEHNIIERKLEYHKNKDWVHGNLQDGKWTKKQIDNYIDCDSQNCRKIVKLSKKEVKQLKDGLGIEAHYCLKHKEYDESGRSHTNKTIEWWDNNTGNKLPSTPILLRIGGIDKEDDDDSHDHIYSRWKKFLKSHNGIDLREHGIVLEKERLEKFEYDQYYYYVKIKDDKTMLEFFNEFSGDFSVHCSSPEILEDGKIPHFKYYEPKMEFVKNG